MKKMLSMEEESLNKEMIRWARETLSTHGFTLKNEWSEKVQDTPWSYVVRFLTTDGYIYLKRTPKLIALEADITRILHDQFHAAVPDIIAHNPELHCFLMRDAGSPLRARLKKKFDVDLLCKAIEQFTAMQLSVADHVNIFIELGVPNWRLDKLPDLYRQLLQQKEILMADGLSVREISELELMTPKVSSLCQKLSEYSIKETFVQCDFHDNNILIDDRSQKMTMIDLGEIVISHPFFSLVGCLRQARFHHGLVEEDEAYRQLLEAGFKNYKTTEPAVSDAFAIAQNLWFVYESLAQYRLRLACDPNRFMASRQHGKLAGRLKEFMVTCGV